MAAAAHINRITPATAVEPHYRNVRGARKPRPGRYATTWELDSSRVLPKPCSEPSSPSPPESRDITLAQRQPIVKAEGIWRLRSLFLSRGNGLFNPIRRIRPRSPYKRRGRQRIPFLGKTISREVNLIRPPLADERRKKETALQPRYVLERMRTVSLFS